MSTNNEKEKAVTSTGAIETPLPNHEAGKEENGSGGSILLFFIVGFVASLLVGWILFPKLLYSEKKQPISFNHQLHVEAVDDGCQSCHFFREDGSFSGVPKLAQCTGCHEEAQGEDPEELKFVEEYVAKGREVPWLVYSRQPNCVFFSHSAHVKMAKMECVTCHGPIGESTVPKIYEQNRITGISRDIWGRNIAGVKRNSWDRMKMDDCAECHAKEAKAEETAVESPMEGFFNNIVRITFPGTEKPGRKSSVQTQHEACFVCHK
ncbi:MAG: menaquinone reductase multiheme cytochrome c subunit QrcA [Thermodesulfobacteriota bacterium]